MNPLRFNLFRLRDRKHREHIFVWNFSWVEICESHFLLHIIKFLLLLTSLFLFALSCCDSKVTVNNLLVLDFMNVAGVICHWAMSKNASEALVSSAAESCKVSWLSTQDTCFKEWVVFERSLFGDRFTNDHRFLSRSDFILYIKQGWASIVLLCSTDRIIHISFCLTWKIQEEWVVLKWQ